jgi:Rps23 Pro-64 3,4-dihydroxylase Tpa1-like proline 4-hydroxylase
LWTAELTDAIDLPEPGGGVLRLVRRAAHPELLAGLSGVDLSGTHVSLTVWEYRGGDFLAPHVDKEEKVLTQIVYLGEHWADGDGGRLLVQRTPDPDDVVARLSPSLGATAVLVRSDDSWHSVESPRPGAAPRRSLNVTYWS